MKAKENTIYDLELHEIYFDNDPYQVIRVPGGWIYRDRELKTNTFVPYDDEFEPFPEADKLPF